MKGEAKLHAGDDMTPRGRLVDEPNTDPDCDWYDTPKSESDTCEFLEAFWGISHAEFVAWVCEAHSFPALIDLMQRRIPLSRTTAVALRSATRTASKSRASLLQLRQARAQ
jgi:hypothetical protein